MARYHCLVCMGVLLGCLLVPGCPAPPDPQPAPRVQKPPPRRPTTDHRANARAVIQRLKKKLRAAHGTVRLGTLLKPEVAQLPKGCDGKGPFTLVDVPGPLPRPALGGRVVLTKGNAPLPGFIVFSDPQSACGAALQNPCLVSYVRSASGLKLRASALSTGANAVSKDATKLQWKNYGGCLILEVDYKTPFFCARPTPKKSYRELYVYDAGTLVELLPKQLTGQDDEGSGTAVGASLTWMTAPQADLLWLAMVESSSSSANSPDGTPQELSKITFHVLTRRCRLRRTTPAEHKKIQGWMK